MNEGKIDIRTVAVISVIVICIFSIIYGIYYQIESYHKKQLNELIEQRPQIEEQTQIVEFDDLFDNSINYQENNVAVNKIEAHEELVYTVYELKDDAYGVNVKIPTININNEKIMAINKEISSIFQEKANQILLNTDEEIKKQTIYNVEYTAYVNENILSLVIRAGLKEGTNVQRVIIQTYTYNLSTNEEMTLGNVLNIEGKSTKDVQSEIYNTIQEAIDNSQNLSALGYNTVNRDINDSMYLIENSNNYFLGPDGVIYIIYAYGNASYSSEKDIVIIK